MTDTADAVDGSETLELRLLFTSEVTLDDDAFALDDRADLDQLVFAQFTCAEVGVDACLIKNADSRVVSDSINKVKRRFDALLVGDFDTENSCHDTLW